MLQYVIAAANHATMEESTVRHRLVENFEELPEQLRHAARYVLDHPRDVALLSMRRQAHEAGVTPATMTRLAQRIGFDGYDSLRDLHAVALRRAEPQTFTVKAGEQVDRQKKDGDRALAETMLMRVAAQMQELTAAISLERLEKAAHTLSAAQRIYCVGMRSSYAIAWQFHYILSMIGGRSTLLDGPGGTGIDLTGRIAEGDVLLAVSVAPYTKATVDLARLATSRGAALIAVTDSEVSPLARIARDVVPVPTDTASFLHTMAPAFAIAEILGALVAGHAGDAALAALKQFDGRAKELGIHIQPQRKRKMDTP